MTFYSPGDNASRNYATLIGITEARLSIPTSIRKNDLNSQGFDFTDDPGSDTFVGVGSGSTFIDGNSEKISVCICRKCQGTCIYLRHGMVLSDQWLGCGHSPCGH